MLIHGAVDTGSYVSVYHKGTKVHVFHKATDAIHKPVSSYWNFNHDVDNSLGVTLAGRQQCTTWSAVHQLEWIFDTSSLSLECQARCFQMSHT